MAPLEEFPGCQQANCFWTHRQEMVSLGISAATLELILLFDWTILWYRMTPLMCITNSIVLVENLERDSWDDSHRKQDFELHQWKHDAMMMRQRSCRESPAYSSKYLRGPLRDKRRISSTSSLIEIREQYRCIASAKVPWPMEIQHHCHTTEQQPVTETMLSLSFHQRAQLGRYSLVDQLCRPDS